MDRRVFSSKASEIWCLLFVRTGVHSGHGLCRLGNQIGQKSCQINMEIPDILSKDGILISLDVGSKKQALQVLVEHVASQTNLAEHKILDVLLERERLGTTGVGSGIAIPHGKLLELNQMIGCFASLNNPIDFESLDGKPVDLIFLLLAPELAGADHLKALAQVSRLLRDTGRCDMLRLATTREKIFNLLVQNPGTTTGR